MDNGEYRYVFAAILLSNEEHLWSFLCVISKLQTGLINRMYNNILSLPSTQQNQQENQYTLPTGEENKVKHGFHSTTTFHKTHNKWIYFNGYILYQIYPNWVEV